MSDFELWWKNFGQFTTPLDKISNQLFINAFKAIAKAAWDAREPEIDAAYDEGFEDGKPAVVNPA